MTPHRTNLTSDAACPCILFALRREAMFFRRLRRSRRFLPAAPLPAALHGDGPSTVLLVETGVGCAAMEKALTWLFSGPRIDEVPYRPTLVISAGFSGAVVSDLGVGDLVVADEVCDADGVCRRTTWPIAAVRHQRGRLLTVPQIIGRPEEKRRLGVRSGAVAVDMETAVVARLCGEAGVPCGCVRAISDDVNTHLSEHLLAILQGGGVQPARLLAALARHPSLIVELLRLAAHTRKAARNLAAGLEDLLSPA